MKNGIKLGNGEQTVITITQMIEDGLIEEVKDPQTKETCEGYVIASRNNNKYNCHLYIYLLDYFHLE
jgi:Mn-dependent DtxR family transcriptional regulator